MPSDGSDSDLRRVLYTILKGDLSGRGHQATIGSHAPGLRLAGGGAGVLGLWLWWFGGCPRLRGRSLVESVSLSQPGLGMRLSQFPPASAPAVTFFLGPGRR